MEIKYLCKIIQIWLEPTTPVIQAYVCVHLTNVFIGNISGIIFTWSTYYRVIVLVFVCLRISHYRVSIYISKQRALSIEHWPIPTISSVIGYSCVWTTVVAREYLVLSTWFNTQCPPYFKVVSKITREFEAQCSLFTYTVNCSHVNNKHSLCIQISHGWFKCTPDTLSMVVKMSYLSYTKPFLST